VLADNALSKSQQAVQSAHAVAQYLLDHPETKWTNGTLVLLKTDDLEAYLPYAESIFREPDLENQITALTFLDKGDRVRNLRLV